LEQFLHAFTLRGFDSVSWAFLFMITRALCSGKQRRDFRIRPISMYAWTRTWAKLSIH